MISGEAGSGKTYLSIAAAYASFDPAHIYNIFPPHTRPVSVQSFRKKLEQSLNLRGSFREIFGTLAHGSVIILNDLEMWWERRSGGLEVINKIASLIEEYGDRFFFIVNANSYALRMINSLTEFENHFLDIIYCNPMSAAELQKLIMVRHNSSGYKFRMDGKEEDDISDTSLAGYFNMLYNYSGGNTSAALNGWLASVKDYDGSFLELSYPGMSDRAFSDLLEPMQVNILVQFILHKKLDETALHRLIASADRNIENDINLLKRTGLITEQEGILEINPFVRHFLLKEFRSREII